MALQESGEMYLETIYILLKENPTVRAIDVGEHMGFSKPSVSRAMGLLRDSGYIADRFRQTNRRKDIRAAHPAHGDVCFSGRCA